MSPLHRRRPTILRATLLAAAFGLTLATIAAAPGTAQPAESKPAAQAEPTPFSHIPADVRAKMQAQQPLSQAADQILWAVERGKASGFAGIALRDDTVALWWKGTPPAHVDQVIANARQRVPVRLHQARHSLAELRAAADRVVASMRANPAGPLHTVEIPVDGSGLVVAGDRAVTAASAGLAKVGVPVRVKVASQPHPQALSRLADISPFYGGARIVNATEGSDCTSGFGVTRNGAYYLLTAGHCGEKNDDFFNGNESMYIGWAADKHTEHDLLLITAIAGNRIFDGGVGSGEFSKLVTNWGWSVPGEYVCHSGSYSGAVCNIQNTNTFAKSLCGDTGCVTDLIEARKVDGGTVGQKGDSGGPVFTLAGDGKVHAKGIVVAGSGSTLWYQDYGTVWRDFGVEPLKG